jgi:Flp pilus assembly protein TadG
MTGYLGEMGLRAGVGLRRLAGATVGRFDRMIGVRAKEGEDGAATIEFALMLPLFMLAVASSVEASMMLGRQAMLERGLDIAAREVQMRTGSSVSDIELTKRICERSAVLTNCEENLLVEMQVVDPPTFTAPRGTPPCKRLNSTIVPPSAYDGAGSNQLVLVRACYAVRPMMPGATLGVRLADNPDGAYRMVASKIFVVE